MMKEKYLVVVFLVVVLVHLVSSVCFGVLLVGSLLWWSGRRENPIRDGHAMIGKTGRTNVNPLGSNGRRRRRSRNGTCTSTSCTSSSRGYECWWWMGVSIVCVIDNGSRPVCRWRRLILIPVATDIVIVVLVSNMIENAGKSIVLQQVGNSVVQRNTP